MAPEEKDRKYQSIYLKEMEAKKKQEMVGREAIKQALGQPVVEATKAKVLAKIGNGRRCCIVK